MRYSALLIAAALAIPGCLAQQPQPAATQASGQAPLPVLRVYANLVQIPVLVLSSTREKIYDPIPSSRFTISFDNGPWFRPADARLEADDPIDLAIVLDARSSQADLLPTIDQAIAKLAPAQLRPQDHVSLYVMSCAHLRSVLSVPADPNQLKSAVDAALIDVTTRRLTRDKSPCSPSAPLWDVLAYAADGLAKAPGRRAVLALTNGSDNKSNRTWNSLISFAQNLGVTIFALNPDLSTSTLQPVPGDNRAASGGFASPPGSGATSGIIPGSLDPAGYLPAVAELTGGIMLRVNGSNVFDPLKRAIEMLRERYIIDFPRPTDATAGVHNLQVRIDRGTYFIRPAGDAVPLATPSQKEAPNTIEPAAPATTQIATSTPAQPTPPQPATAPQAQQPATPPSAAPQPPTPALKVTTRLTLVDVTVTDKDNHPIRGLLKPDFTIKEDNKPQPIRDFAEYGAEGRPAPLPPLPPNTFTNQLAATTGATNIILLDEVSTGLRTALRLSPQFMAYARLQSASYIKRMPPGTQLAILSLNDGIRVVQPLTADRDLLLKSLHDFKYKPVAGAYVNIPGTSCDVANTQSRLTVQALDQVAAYLAGIKGRKTLIWFTPGTPWLTNYIHFSTSPCLVDYTLELARSYNLLTAAQVALYPVAPQGLETASPDASTSGIPGLGYTATAISAINDQRDSVRAYADATGGIAYTDRNDLDAALAEAITTGSDYYSLSYTPPRLKEDNLFHSISVAVDRPTVRLQYSSGYSDGVLSSLGPTGRNAAALDPGYHPEMRYDSLDSTQLTFNLRPDLVGARPPDAPFLGMPNPALKNPRFSRYIFNYTFIPGQVAFTDDPDGGRHASIEFVLVAFDADGKPLNNLRQQLKLTFHPGQPEAFLSQPFDSPISFDVPGNTVTLRAGIFDLTARKSGTIDIPLTPPKP